MRFESILQKNAGVQQAAELPIVSRTAHEEFGVRRGVVSWDTFRDFGSSPPVRAFAIPPPARRDPDTLSASAEYSGHNEVEN